VVAEALDRASPAAVVVMKSAAVLAVGGGAWCLHFAPVMLLDLHPSVLVSSVVPSEGAAVSAEQQLIDFVKRFGDEDSTNGAGHIDDDGAGFNRRRRSGSSPGQSEHRDSVIGSLSSSQGGHIMGTGAGLDLLDTSGDVGRSHRLPRRARLWERLKDAEARLFVQRQKCEYLFQLSAESDPTER